MEEEKEELAIAEEFHNAQTVQDLTTLMRKGQMKEFYKKANELLKIRRAHPVVSKIQKLDETGEVTVFEDKEIVEREVANYFTEIYKRPSHMRAPALHIDFDVEDEEMQIDTGSDSNMAFTREEVAEAMKSCNFNKGLGPDCFDGGVLHRNEQLKDKLITEIVEALNSASIPTYLREGRLVPLQKTLTKGPVALDDIRPIVVRSHISKIMEKAILAKVRQSCPHLIESKVY